ncbi:MAG: ubiquitin-like domain-containing protein [Micrococcales bacterium]|nr:ubiquitin-like domain-containing protein [Micrococcales bacterium]
MARADGQRGGPRVVGRLARVMAQALVLAVIAASTTAFAVLHKRVELDVDGTQHQVQAFGRTVADVLAAAHVTVGPDDDVSPGINAPITAGEQVVVRHARDFTVDIDGQTQQFTTTALTVGEVVDGLGMQGDDVRLSASRSAELGTQPLQISTQKTVYLAVDGQVITGVTTAATVRDALKDIGLVLDDGDQVSVPLDAPVVDGLVVMVTRAATTGQKVTEVVPFDTQQVDDPTLITGTTKVQTPGKAGVRTTTYDVQVVGGVVVSRTELTSAITTPPVTQVVLKGTKPLPDPKAVAVSPGSAQALGKQMAASRGWGDDQFACLLNLWGQESGWNTTSQNRYSGAYGIPQALPGSKMASAGADWKTSASTQIAWGLSYIAGRYGTPCNAYGHKASSGWY